MKLQIVKGSTSRIITVFIQDTGSTVGAGLGSLDQASLIVGGYVRAGGTGVALAVDENVTTEGTYQAPTAAGKVRIGTPANMRTGTYELHFHNDLFAVGADGVFITLGGATDMAELVIEIQLVGWIDSNDRVDVGSWAGTAVVLSSDYPKITVGSMDNNVLVDSAVNTGAFVADAFAAGSLNGKGNWNTVTPDAAGVAPTAAEVADAVWDEAGADHVAADSMGAQVETKIDSILADVTGLNGDVMRGTDGANTTVPDAAGVAPTAAEVADAVWDEALADHDTEDSVGNVVNDLVAEDSGGVYQLTANSLELAPTVAAAASSSQGAVDEFDLTVYQHAVLGPFTFTAVEAQTGDSHAMTVYKAEDPTDGVFELTTGGEDISVGGDGDKTVTVSQDDTNTATAGVYLYILRNTSDDTVIAEGSLTIKERPEVGS